MNNKQRYIMNSEEIKRLDNAVEEFKKDNASVLISGGYVIAKKKAYDSEIYRQAHKIADDLMIEWLEDLMREIKRGSE